MSLDVVLSTETIYQSNADYGISHEVVGLSPSTYLLLTFDASSGSGPLTVVPVTLVHNSSTGTYDKVFGVSQSLTGRSLAFDMKATKLDDYTAVVAYVNAADNNVLYCTVISLDATATNNAAFVTFGSSIAVSSGLALEAVFGGYTYMDLDIQTLAQTNASSAQAFVVLYSDVSNKGKMTAAAIEVG